MERRRTRSSAPDRTLPIELVRAAVSFAIAQQWDVNQILHQAGIPPLLLAQGRARITEAQATSIVQAMWHYTDDEAFGMGAHPLPRGSFRLLLYGASGAPDLGAALDRVQGFSRAMPALPPVGLVRDGDAARLSLDLTQGFDDPEHLMTYTGLAVAHRVMSWAVARPIPLRAVELPFRAPASREMPELVFGAPQVYETPRPALVFDASWLTAPLMRDEAAVDLFVARSPAGLLARPTNDRTSTADQVRRLVVQGLRSEQPPADHIAERLAMSPQTLRRKLAAQETSLRQIRDEVLRDAAVSALVAGNESLAEIAERLGFSEPSAFTRAFRRWTGSPPSAYRRESKD
ncbi:AraC family transcriptional regulator [Nocardioides humilatus]|uniref:AraC family transcriptional regulator n=1 Tax=Nocardioides humilatus TaxID=2607660 RepID=A0A5B1LMT7_9ACTN|nr:AraC family transcriptional regulator [Nocardioides humilatus]KAA1421824.1 AraC family transcriptional regulator [Nocardioides humilatus]